MSFSKSPQWRKLLYYQKNNKSLAEGESFFLHKDGKKNPLEELKANITAFESNSKSSNNEFHQCLFPARFSILNEKWPGKFEKQNCIKFKKWNEGIDISNVYLAFTSSYPNNPASMFGHTFLRFDRKSKGELKTTKELIGYSLGFQANTKSTDDAFSYTLKGLFGGYYTHVEIKPHYINIGIYNNGESRDLWYYKLDLTEKEKLLLVQHAWELSIAGAFKYYFFDRNCSSYLNLFLEVLRPEIDFHSNEGLFVVPQETLREIVDKFNSKDYQYRASLKKRIIHQMKNLSNNQIESFNASQKSLKELNENVDVETLDALTNYWKFKNYKEHTNLKENEKDLMYATLLKRSQIQEKTNEVEIDMSKSKDLRPDKGHDFSKVSLAGGEKQQELNFRYGFHDFHDNEIGFDRGAYIKFFDLNLKQKESNRSLKIDIIDILSLQDFYWYLPTLSWNAGLSYVNNDQQAGSKLQAGAGVSQGSENWQMYTLGTINTLYTNVDKKIFPSLNFGGKYLFTKTWKIVVEASVTDKKFTSELKGSFIYQSGDWQASLEHRSFHEKTEHVLGMTYYF